MKGFQDLCLKVKARSKVKDYSLGNGPLWRRSLFVSEAELSSTMHTLRSRFRVQGSGFRVQGLEFRVQGSGFRV